MKNFTQLLPGRDGSNAKTSNTSGHAHAFTLILTLLLTFGVGQMWGWTISNAKVYYDNTNSAYSCGVRFIIEKSNGCCVKSMSLISGTNNLYYWDGTWGDGAVSNLRFGSDDYTTDWYEWWKSVGNFTTLANNEGFCSYTNTYGIDVNNAFKLFTAGSGNKGANITPTNLSDYSSLNYTQTLYQCVAENGGTPAKSTASIGTISITTKKLNGNSSTTNDNGSITSGQNNVAKSAARTATVTMTATGIADGYTFLGWYDAESGGTRLESSTTYTYQASATKTVYARFSHETTHTVSITYKCGSTTVSTATNQAIGQVTASAITAPTVTGYTFSNWTLGTGISNQSGSTTANPISVKTLSSGTYTMQANYAEDLTSPWHLLGVTKPFGGWDKNVSNMLTKETGSSTASVASIVVPVYALPSAEEYTFKLYNEKTGKWRTNGGYWVTRKNNNPTLSTADGTNLIFKPDVAGNYVFTLDYSGANPVLTVTYPTAYTLPYSIGSVPPHQAEARY